MERCQSFTAPWLKDVERHLRDGMPVGRARIRADLDAITHQWLNRDRADPVNG